MLWVEKKKVKEPVPSNGFLIQQNNEERIAKGLIKSERDVYKVKLIHFNDLRL